MPVEILIIATAVEFAAPTHYLQVIDSQLSRLRHLQLGQNLMKDILATYPLTQKVPSLGNLQVR